MERTLKQVEFNGEYVCLQNGAEARDFLTGKGRYAGGGRRQEPTLIVTDLKMPLMNGIELLQWVRQQPELAGVPTIVFSSSNRIEDVRMAYGAGANTYFLKPMGPEGFRTLAEVAIEYWNHSALPISGEGRSKESGAT